MTAVNTKRSFLTSTGCDQMKEAMVQILLVIIARQRNDRNLWLDVMIWGVAPHGRVSGAIKSGKEKVYEGVGRNGRVGTLHESRGEGS
jgi:hypothetical protein